MRTFTFYCRYIIVLCLLLCATSQIFGQRHFATTQQSGATGLLCLGCVVNNQGNAIDANLQTYSTLNVTVGLIASTYQELIFPTTVPANTPLTIKLGTGDNLLDVTLLGGVTITPYNGSVAGTPVTAPTLASVASNNNQLELIYAPTQAYDRVRVTLSGGLLGALSSIYLYDAFYTTPGPPVCNTPYDELHGISSALLGLGLNVGGVANPQNAIDGNLNTASTLNAGVGALGAFAQQTIVFQSASTVGDSVKLTLTIPKSLLDVGLLSSISISTFNGNTDNNDTQFLSASLLTIRLLDFANNRQRLTVSYVPPKVFDRVQLRLGGVANVLSTLDLNEGEIAIPQPIIKVNNVAVTTAQLCAGSTVTLNATANLAGTTFSWFTQPTGGTAVFTGASFTTPALTNNITYYVSATRPGCATASTRAPVTINVNQIPVAPVVANANTTVCPGSTAIFAATPVTGVTINWYAAATGGTPLFTGNTFTSPALTATTSYYAEAVSGGTCVSTTRTKVTATISPLPVAPTLTTPNVTICDGDVAVLAIASPVAGQTYNWYATATGGTPLFTGTNFTSPALSANTTYYAEAVNAAGCVSGTRAVATVTVSPKPAAPVLAVNNSTIVAGQTATINVSNAQTGITYNWYTSAAAATPVFTGNPYTTPALFSTTTYYVAAVNAAGCESVTRTPITITVTINTNSPCTFANQQSTSINGLCLLCVINNGALAADADTTTASTITVPVGLLGGSASQTLIFPNPGFAGDTIKLALQTPGGLADVSLLGGITVAVYNGATLVGTYPLNNTLLTLRLLSGSGKYAAYIPAVGNYDRIVVTLNSGAATLLTSLQIYYAVQQYPTPKFNPTAPEICKGSPATLNITSSAPANGTFSWFTTPTGGTAVHTGTSYTTPALTANTTYYVEYSRSGSCVSPTRAPVQVIVDDAPVKPVVTPSSATILAGQTATFKATVVNGATIKWYTSATGGTPVFTGSTFTTPVLNANTTYYAEASLGSCVSPDRTVVPVTVTPIVIPDVSVNPPTQSVNIGTSGTITASSTTPGTVFNWYTTPTGGTPIFTGPTFVTPAVFANTTYYAEAVVTATGAISATRAAGVVNIIPVATSPVACDAATAQTNSANGLCLLCGISNAGGAIDNDRNTFSQIHVPIGLLGGSAQQTLQFAHAGIVGDSVIVELGIPGSLADVGVLSQIQIGTYNGATFNNDFFSVNGSLLNVTLLNGTSRFRVAFKAGAAFDRVEIQFNSGVAGLLNAVNVYDAYQSVASPTIGTANVSTCQGTSATLTATNVPANVTIKWYTAASGGTAVFTGANFVTPVLNATTTYYAEASRTVDGCAQGNRTPAVVTIVPAPAAPVANATTVAVCSGQPAIFTVQAVNGVTFTWYATATGGTPLFTGPQFTSPALTANTSYYVQANAGSCGSSARTQVTANVVTTPTVPTVVTPVQICSGSSAVLTASSTQAGVTFNWYTTATGGTPVFTGPQYTTPALTASTSYYVEAASTGGCTSSTRAKADVSVNPTPVAPTITAPGQVTSGQTVTLAVTSPVAGVTYKWYASATGGTPIFTGTSFTTPPLTSNTTYYVEATSAAGCTSVTRTSVDVIVNPIFSTSCDFASTQTFDVNGGLLCVGCAVNNPNNSVDQDTTNFSQLSVPIGLVGSNVSQKLIFSDAGVVGDTVTVKIAVPASLATVGVLNQLQIASFNGATYNNDRVTLSSSLLKITLLNGNQTALVKFAPQSAFDRVEIRFNGALASLFNTLNIYYATKQVEAPRLAANAVSLCSGSTATFTVNNARAGVQYKWYTSATGGTSVHTGSTFTTAALTATTTYYVESSRVSSSCANPNRVAATANVTPAPVNPVLAQASVPVCSGSTAVLTVSPTQAGVVYNWYAAATGGTPLFTGAQVTTPALTANTSYYVEASANGCVSPARTRADVTVNPVPVAPTVAVSPAGGQVTTGSSATLTASSTTVGAIFKWYTAATGGTPVFTGSVFVTPPLTATTTYYAESSLASGCVSAQRTPVILTVTQPIIIPDVAVNPPTQTVNAGTSGSLTASSTTPGAVFNWFTTPTGGTSIFTGANFVSPGIFAQTTYYAESSIPATGAVSTSRASGIINVKAIGPNPVPCDAAIDQTSSVNGICLLCGVSNAGGSVDNNTETFSQIHVPVGLLGGSAQQTLRFANTGIVGDSLTVDLGIPGSLADVGLLSQIQVATYNGSTYNGDRVTVDGSLLKITLLNGTTRFKYKFKAAHTFDRVEITFNSGVAGLLSAVNVYDAYQSVASPTISTANVTICSGSQATLSATVPANVTVRWYTSASGGTAVFTGATFTTPALTANTTYYAEASRTADGCAQAIRTPATVTVTPAPAKPVVTVPTLTVCSGQPATFTAQAVAGVTFNWYTTPTGGTPVFTGPAFTTPLLTSTTSYYVEATSAAACGSSSRTQVTANVTATPLVPIVSQTPVSTCSGSSAVLSATSTQAGVTFNWYTTPTGGTPVFTGPQFTTPALTASTSYYVEATAGGCTSSTRAKADVIVNPTPVAPVITSNAPGGQITSGQTATLTATSTTAGATFNWYTSATGGTPIFTGSTFTTPPLTSNTTYYVEAVLTSSGCISTTRTAVLVKVNPIFSTNCDFASTQTFDVNGGLVCIACGVTDENNSVDQDTTNFSQLHLPISVLGSYVAQKLIFTDQGLVGDTVTLKISVPGNLADVSVLGSIQLASYNGATYNNDRITLSSNLLKITVLAGGQTAIVKFAPKTAFDRVEVRLNSGIATLLTTLNIYYASKQVEAPRLATNTVNICAGGTATFTVSNQRAGVTYRWYTAAVGGTLVHTGATYSPTNVLATTTYYVESSHTATLCPNPNRVGATVNVTPSPVNPILTKAAFEICAGQSVTFAVTNANGATINWYTSPTGGTPVFTGATFTVSPVSDIIYYIEAANGTCTSPARTVATVKVDQLPSKPGVQASNVEVCSGSPATLAVTSPQAGVDYNWYTTATGGTSVHTGATFTTPAITQNITYYIEATNSTTSCVNGGGRTAVNITPNGLPIAPTLSATQSSVCNGGSLTISVTNPVAGVTYNWYTAATGGTAVFTGTSFALTNLTANATYYVEAVSASSCTSTSRTQTDITVLPVPPTPVIQIPSGGLTACSGSSATINISNPQTGLVYRWYDAPVNGTLLFTGTQFITPALTATTTYYVEAASAGNCNSSARAQATVTVTPLPPDPVVANANQQVCLGSTATLSIQTPQAGITYNWYDSTTKNHLLFTGNPYTTGAITATTDFYVEAVNSTGCSSNGFAFAQVTVVSAPGAPVIAGGNTVPTCSGSTATLTVSNPSVLLTYKWYSSATGGVALASGVTFTTPVLTANTSYYAEASNSIGCTSATRTQVNVVINQLPSGPTVTTQAGSSTPTVCAGGSAVLIATSTTPGVTFKWYDVATGGTPIFTGAQFTTPVISAATTYYVEAVNTATGCTSSSPRTSVTITIDNTKAPDPTLDQTSLTTCQNSAATIKITNPVAGTTYNWYTSATGGTSIFTGSAFTTPVLTANTTYYVEATNAQSCNASTRIAAAVTVTPQPPTPTVSVPNPQVCLGSVATLSVASPQAGITYNWYTDAARTNLVFTGASFPIGAVNANATYYVEAASGSCSSSGVATVQVTAVPAPGAPVIAGGNSVNDCAGGSVTLTISNPQTGFTYNWYSSASGGTALASGTSFTTPTLTTNTIYFAEAVNNTGCPSASRTSVTVTVTSAPIAPQASAQGTSICPGTSTTISATSATPGATINWYAANTGGAILFTGTDFTTPVLSANTTYYAEAEVAGGCVSVTRTPVTVTILTPLAAPIVSVGSTTAESITFTWAAVTGATGYQISLDNGQHFVAPSTGAAGLSHTVSGLQPGASATIIVRATGNSACQLSANSAAVTGTTSNPFGNGLFIPNAFTPNGDGNNDILYVYGTTISTLTLSIYDQWGELQFKSTNKASGWDGTYKGNKQPVGVYVYYVEATMNDGQVIKKKGTVTLLR
ncbi:gliding motility-associated C-terminal domain-containing protein [Mucilaginibacter lappiensis]|uniref:Gliding motility-associated-like protein n=1 Tax=Mucilaginibacter lappiensis TaxID=354630 RepID=A0ABR6PNQ5_9SPHI|nr:gliding motility-associated C-terminal domain-containing protein [Mucilaginibacter lappiensis]MBB6111408.1 gliding motility-associated-like protein [Mucilaginibacter lappiensis]SIR78649.1 gliding motility-associated C-terminal domain-containing protein [Mucilaginibacter lappiensis]